MPPRPPGLGRLPMRNQLSFQLSGKASAVMIYGYGRWIRTLARRQA